MSSRRLAFAALVVLGVALAADAFVAVDVTYVLPPTDAEGAGAGFAPGDDPALRHGVPVPGGTERVLLADRSRLVTPPEAPDRRLLILPRNADLDAARPLTARRLWVVALSLAVALVMAAVFLRAREGARAGRP